jgi:CO/xanthine dehydrogenase Mo-binding subunit
MGFGYFDSNTELLNLETCYGEDSTSHGFAAHVVEVEIDPDTGVVNILKYVAVHDVGRALNPAIIENQIYGGVLQGIGYTLYEDMIYDKNGRLLNPNFTDYKIPTNADVPQIKAIILQEIDSNSPIGAKGIGEAPIQPPAPAIANAIYDAIGVRFKELPITPEKILKALKKRAKDLM